MFNEIKLGEIQNKNVNCPCINITCENHSSCISCMAKHEKLGNLPSCKRVNEQK